MSEPLACVLVVEDEPQIRRVVRSALEEEGCRVIESGTMTQGLTEAATRKPSLIILDLGLPDGDGARFVEDVRTWSAVPILILSARSTENDKIDVLDAGADDYLTKPFSLGELLARVRALLRRARISDADASPLVGFSDIEVDLPRRSVTRGGEPLHLTPIEFRLLCALLAGHGKVLTHRHLLREVWGPGYGESNHYLRIYVGHLRQKLERDPAQPRHILTETGVGYRFAM